MRVHQRVFFYAHIKYKTSIESVRESTSPVYNIAVPCALYITTFGHKKRLENKFIFQIEDV